MRTFDAFPFVGSDTELLLLECRLTELYDTVDAFVIVESNLTHQGDPKPLRYLEHADRFAAWKDKITHVVHDEGMLPRGHPDWWTWSNEHAQREGIGVGLNELDADDDDICLQSDADEIARAVVVRNLRIRDQQRITLRQRGHFWAVDWLYPEGNQTLRQAMTGGWSGTVATTVGNLKTLHSGTAGAFAMMRNSRNLNTMQLPNAGWHFSWLGKGEAAHLKVGSFCHPEVKEQMTKRVGDDFDFYWREGFHVGGGEGGAPVKMYPVDVDKSWPKWMQDPANVPETWFRPR